MGWKVTDWKWMFLAWFLLFNLTGLLDFPFYSRPLVASSALLLFCVSLAGYLCAILMQGVLNGKPGIKPRRLTFCNKKKLTLYLAILVAASCSSVIYASLQKGGLIITQDSQRFLNSAYMSLVAMMASVAIVLYYAECTIRGERLSWRFISVVLIYIFFLGSLGYRAPIIQLLVAIFFIYLDGHCYRTSRIQKGAFIGALLLCIIGFASVVSAYRISQLYEIQEYFRNIEWTYAEKSRLVSFLAPTLSLFRYDQEVVNWLVEALGENFLYGKLAVSNIVTLLPGEQYGARNIIGELIGARYGAGGKPWSTTPTLQGALYVDGGVLGVLFGSFITMTVLIKLRDYANRHMSSMSLSLYYFFLVALMKSVHTGYFDVSFYLLLFSMSVLYLMSRRPHSGTVPSPRVRRGASLG